MDEITTQQAYEWVKTGVWNLKQFQSWVDEKISNEYREGYNDGRDAPGYDSSTY